MTALWQVSFLAAATLYLGMQILLSANVSMATHVALIACD